MAFEPSWNIRATSEPAGQNRRSGHRWVIASEFDSLAKTV